jgi:D-beta-D-heptose 7-phosphate kinase/D-beta-D-heptose 1-phosphate adenosyltransferase
VQTTVKTRVLAERQQVVRVDRENSSEIPDGAIGELCSRAAELAGEVDGVIVEDYGKGAVCQPVVEQVLASARERGIPVGFDPKEDHPLEISGVTLATPNYREACAAAGLPYRPLGGDAEDDSCLGETAAVLVERWKPDLLCITLGPRGMYVRHGNGGPVMIPTRAREVFDVSGAGDTVIAVALLSLSCGATHEEAASLANYAAGVVVGKVGTAPCTPGELLQSVGQAPA